MRRILRVWDVASRRRGEKKKVGSSTTKARTGARRGLKLCATQTPPDTAKKPLQHARVALSPSRANPLSKLQQAAPLHVGVVNRVWLRLFVLIGNSTRKKLGRGAACLLIGGGLGKQIKIKKICPSTQKACVVVFAFLFYLIFGS